MNVFAVDGHRIKERKGGKAAIIYGRLHGSLPVPPTRSSSSILVLIMSFHGFVGCRRGCPDKGGVLWW